MSGDAKTTLAQEIVQRAADTPNWAIDRERVAEAIWHRMAQPHRASWEDEPDKDLYRHAAEAAMEAMHVR